MPPVINVNQRWRDGRARYRPTGEMIRPAEYEVAPIPEATAKAFVLQHHYSRTYPAARHRIGLFRRGLLAGVAVFSQPVQDCVLTRWFPTGSALDSVELGRFVLMDHVPGNGESWFLARSFEVLRREALIGVLSFSDPVPRRTSDGILVMPGHVGTCYQAANTVYLGRGTPRTHRLLPDGSILSPRALQKIRAGEQGWRYAVEQLVRHGAWIPTCLNRGTPDLDELRPWLERWKNAVTRPLRHPGNHRYAWGLTRLGARCLTRLHRLCRIRRRVILSQGRPRPGLLAY